MRHGLVKTPSSKYRVTRKSTNRLISLPETDPVVPDSLPYLRMHMVFSIEYDPLKWLHASCCSVRKGAMRVAQEDPL